MSDRTQERYELRLGLVTLFVNFLSEEASSNNLHEALEDLEKIERYILGETE